MPRSSYATRHAKFDPAPYERRIAVNETRVIIFGTRKRTRRTEQVFRLSYRRYDRCFRFRKKNMRIRTIGDKTMRTDGDGSQVKYYFKSRTKDTCRHSPEKFDLLSTLKMRSVWLINRKQKNMHICVCFSWRVLDYCSVCFFRRCKCYFFLCITCHFFRDRVCHYSTILKARKINQSNCVKTNWYARCHNIFDGKCLFINVIVCVCLEIDASFCDVEQIDVYFTCFIIHKCGIVPKFVAAKMLTFLYSFYNYSTICLH